MDSHTTKKFDRLSGIVNKIVGGIENVDVRNIHLLTKQKETKLNSLFK